MQPESSDHQLLQLLEKYLKGECSEDEKQEVEAWYDTFESRLAVMAPVPATALEALYDDMVRQLKQEQEWAETPPAKKRFSWWKAAAVVLVLLAATWTYRLLQPPSMLEISTPAGTNLKTTLPDGTMVWLNAGSRLQYGKEMRTGSREIRLQGEGYFEVARNDLHPFIIHMPDITLKVLGTRFNLKAYTGDPTLEVALLQGKVAVSLNSNPVKSRVLAPQEKLTLTRKTGGTTTEDPQQDWGVFTATVAPIQQNGEDDTMWRNNQIKFNNKSFAELARIMERWFGKTIIIQDASLNSNRFNGTFRREDITRALKALQITADFAYKIKGDTVFIYNQSTKR